jgi:hypothetical protein
LSRDTIRARAATLDKPAAPEPVWSGDNQLIDREDVPLLRDG